MNLSVYIVITISFMLIAILYAAHQKYLFRLDSNLNHADLPETDGSKQFKEIDEISLALFISETKEILNFFVEVILNTSKQSILVVQRIDEMVKEMDKIFEILFQAARIANQTNLLALNAAIEAARAGGEGFLCCG